MKVLKRITKIVLALFLVLVVLDALLVFGIGYTDRDIPETDAIIILGAAINTPALYNRSLEGLRLYEQGKGRVLVLSGGRISDADISEAEYMEKVIKKNAAVSSPNMILEEDSHSTYENIRNSKQKIPDASSVVVVSDEFHVARGVLMAKAAGFEDVYWSSPEPTYYRPVELGRYYLRELVAMFAYIPKFLFI